MTKEHGHRIPFRPQLFATRLHAPLENTAPIRELLGLHFAGKGGSDSANQQLRWTLETAMSSARKV